MITKGRDTIGIAPPKEVTALIKLLETVIINEKYLHLVNSELHNSHDFEVRKSLLTSWHFSGSDFMSLLGANGDGKGVLFYIADSLLKQLIEWGLVGDVGFFIQNAYTRYQWHKSRIELFSSLQILDNILLGPAYVAQKYRSSVPALLIKKGEDHHIGTGFLATNQGNLKRSVIVTAKHNVNPADETIFQSFSSANGIKYELLSEDWTLHPSLDIAFLPVSCSAPVTPIFLVGDAQVLSRTITLGYPRIATTDAPYLLAHGGELNAIVSTYHGETHLVISNIVAPGNSGGPVLDEAGLCVGMVVQSLETTHEGGKSSVNAAIPSKAILDFILPYLSSK